MNILVLTNLYPPDYNGGYELACAQAVDALRARGHSVTVVTATPRFPVPPENDVLRRFALPELLLDYRRASRSDPHIHRLRTLEAAGFSAHNVQLLLGVLDEVRPDVVYLWNIDGLGVLGLLGALALLQVPVTWHLMDQPFARMSAVLAESRESVAAPLSRDIRGNHIACSTRLRAEIERSGYPLRDRVSVIPNWVVTPPSTRTRGYYPDESAVLRLVAAGQLLEHKGIDIILDAAHRVVERDVGDFHIDLYGDGDVERYRRTIDELGLARHVALRGRKPQGELAQVFLEYDAFLFPTWRREPFGMAPLEAAACGCVPIISRSCGIAEWLIDGHDCIKVPRDAAALARTLEDVLIGRVELAAIGRRSRSVVTRGFDLDRIVVRIERALEGAAAMPVSAPTASPEDVIRLVHHAEEFVMDVAESTGSTA